MHSECGFTGCKAAAVYEARQTVGKCQTILTCEEHRPGAMRATLPPDHPVHRFPIFYTVRRLATGEVVE